MVEQAQEILINVPDPCPDVLQALARLVEAREVRTGLRLEAILHQAIAPLVDRIGLAIVYGSVARKAQTSESDVDLLIVGDIRLKELIEPLMRAQETLGRQINPVIYSSPGFRQKYRAGDPFLLNVVRHEKIFVKGTADELRVMIAEELPDSP